MPTNQTPQREMPSKIRDELLDKTRGTDMTNKHKVMAVETQTGVGQTKGYSGAGIKHENRSFRAKIKYLAGSLDGDDVLKLSEDLFKQLFDSNANHRYVAIHSIQNSLPHLGWLLFSAELDRTLPPHTCAVAVTIRFSLPSNVMIRACSPCNLESAILSLPPNAYREMEHETAAEVLAKFETNGRFPLLRQGEFRPEVPCRVRLCEPVDQGRLTKDTKLILVKEQSVQGNDSCPHGGIDGELNIDVEIDQFLDIDGLEIASKQKAEICLKVLPLSSAPIPDFLNPVPDLLDDLETIGLAKIENLATIGCFSGDIVEVSSPQGSRLIRLFSYPDQSPTDDGALYMPPILIHNLGTPQELKVSKHSSGPIYKVLPAAKEVTISRVASPVTTDRTFQNSFLSGLRSYFESSCRIVKVGDLIAIPVDTILSQTLYSPGEDTSGLVLPSGKPDDVAWFKIASLEADDDVKQYDIPCIIDPSVTRMIQSGIVQERAVSSDLAWRKYLSLPDFPDYDLRTNSDCNLFIHAKKLQKLIRASFSPLGRSLQTTVLLTSSKRGAGKSTVIKSVAASMGIHLFEIDCYSISGEGDAKAIGTLRARFERALSISPVIVYLHHLDILAKKSEQDGNDVAIVSNIISMFEDYSTKENLIIAASVADTDKLSDAMRAKFTFEVAVSVPSENERKKIFEYLAANKTQGSHMVSFISQTLPIQYSLRNDISIETLALQSAGLTPPDLVSIFEMSKSVALRRLQTLLASKDDYQNLDMNSLIIASRGAVKITPDDIENAIGDARSKYSDSIGAPKIPKVGWEDVGGLEGVKKEILDSIEMPLKFPHLFSQGVKKRSGILFYGPPGTGKTLLAKAIATTFSLNFFSVKGPELLNMYIGESEANVRRVFEKARDAKPCVVFFDELDSVAPKRGNQGDSGGVMDRIVSQLLAELDGMSGAGGDGVFVVGATNRPDLLDEALLRPGRFDKMLYLGISDTHNKQLTILEALTRKFTKSAQLDLENIANHCPFTFTGADFYAMSSDALLNAMIRTAGQVDDKIKVYNQKERRSKGLNEVNTRWWFQNVATPEDTKVEVTMADFEKAQRELSPSVSHDELQHYLRVRQNFEGGKTGGENNNSSLQTQNLSINGEEISVNGTTNGHFNAEFDGKTSNLGPNILNGNTNGNANSGTKIDRKGKNKVTRKEINS